MDKHNLTPLTVALDEIINETNRQIKKQSAEYIKECLHPTNVRCIGENQKKALDNALKCLGIINPSESTTILNFSADIFSLAIKDCLNCSNENCEFRDKESSGNQRC